MSINTVAISGNLTKDAELRKTSGGMYVLGFTVAVNDRRKNDDGKWEDFPNYIDCTLFGNRAEAVDPFMVKGAKVSIQGKLRQSSWEGDDGKKRSKVSVIVDELEFLSRSNPERMQPEDPQESLFEDEEIPF